MGSYLNQSSTLLVKILCAASILSVSPDAFCADISASSPLSKSIDDFNAKKYGVALKGLNIYLQTNPNDYQAHYYLANTMVKLGKIDEASDEYKKVLTLTPDSKTGSASMEAFNKIADMRSSQPPQISQFPQTQSQKPAPSAQSYSQTPFVANNQFSYGRNFPNNAGNNPDLIPASVAGSGAKVSPTISPARLNSYGNQGLFGQPNFRHSHFGGLGPYGNYGSQNQFGNSGSGNTSFNNSGYGNSGFSNYGRMRHHRNRFQNAYNGSSSGGYRGGRYTSYPGDSSRYHMGGYIQNYEITDTPSGNAVPLVAEQKKFEDLATETTGTRSGIAASRAAKSKISK